MMHDRKGANSQNSEDFQEEDDAVEHKIVGSDYSGRLNQVINSAEEAFQIQNQIEHAHLPDAKLQDVLISWVQGITQPKRYQYYRELIDLYLIPDLGEITLQSFLPQQLQQFYQQKYAEGYSVQIIESLHYILQQTFTTALNSHLVETNICDAVTPDCRPPEVMFTGLSHPDHERVCRILIRIAMYFEEKDSENLSAKKQ